MNGQHSISIAVLTDNQDDVALINSALRDAGHAAHCHWVSRPEALSDTLYSHRVELLILNSDRYSDHIHNVIRRKNRYRPATPVCSGSFA